jgi:hypothetical protein
MRELLLAFPLRRIRPGALLLCAVVIAHELLYRLLVHALPSLGDALTALPLTLQLRPQGLLASHHRLPPQKNKGGTP